MIKAINDIHLDVNRVGGTTETSREALQLYAVNQFKNLLARSKDADHLLILGDLFNKAKVEEWVFLEVYKALVSFMADAPNCVLILVRGNHDSRSKDRQNLCSLELLANISQGNVVFVFDAPYLFEDDGKVHYVIPHMFNQEQFDAAVSAVTDEVDFLYLHSNVDNPFAVGDHSINISKDQVKTLHDKGVTVICGHEHQRRRPFPNVHVIGNQFPTSISDCKGNDEKFLLRIENGQIVKERTWTAAGNYYDVPVELLDTVPDTAQFVRVHGEVAKADFAKVIQEVDKFRRKSSAFVVSNAVSVVVEGKVLQAEEVTNINVVELLIQAVPEKYREKCCLLLA